MHAKKGLVGIGELLDISSAEINVQVRPTIHLHPSIALKAVGLAPLAHIGVVVRKAVAALLADTLGRTTDRTKSVWHEQSLLCLCGTSSAMNVYITTRG